MKRHRLRELTDEDRVLWRRVTNTITPIGKREDASRSRFAEMLKGEQQDRDSSATVSEPREKDDLLSQPLSVAPRPRLAIERPVRDKIAKGRIQLDARIDLHGMTQHQAHAVLLNFLHQACRHRLRHVLVITGKGSSRGSDGVLNRTVPEWLATPPFHPLVSGCSQAARHHGGSGALYVRLRRRKDGRIS